jgi:hypothetical protein
MSTETNTVLAAAPMDVTVNETAEVVAPKKRGRKPKTETVVGTAAAPKKGVKKGLADSKKDVDEESEEKPKKKAKKEKSEKNDNEEDAKVDAKEKKPKAKKEKVAKDDAKDDSNPKKRARKTGSKTNADGSPKKPRALSSYMLFFKTVRAKVAAENPSLKTTEIGRKLGEMWRALSEDEKKAFKSSDSSSQPAVAEAVVCVADSSQ